MAEGASALEDLRREIDRIDDAIHDLLMRRTELVGGIGAAKRGGRLNLRPAREAAILRRLIGRHHGPFPKSALIRIWREIMGAFLHMQGTFTVAVATPHGELAELARGHFGTMVQLRMSHSNGEVLSAVIDGQAAVGLLPEPREGDKAPWWPLLCTPRGRGLKVAARLPFDDRGLPSLLVAALDPEPSGADRTLIGLRGRRDVSRAQLFARSARAGLTARYLDAWEDEHREPWFLAEVDRFVAPDDEAVGAVAAALDLQPDQVLVLGTYAEPLRAADLAATPEGSPSP